jgi:hypothetical protein
MATRATHVYAILRAITAAETRPSTLSRSKHRFYVLKNFPLPPRACVVTTLPHHELIRKSDTFQNIMINNTTKCYYTDAQSTKGPVFADQQMRARVTAS